MLGRAVLWLGYLRKPTIEKAGSTFRSRYRYSLRRFISMFLRKPKRRGKN